MRGVRLASWRHVLVAIAVAATLVLPAASPAHASGRCGSLVSNVKTNTLRLKAGGTVLLDYHVTVSWCTAPNGSVAPRVYSPKRTNGHRVTTAGLLGGWQFDRVLSEQREYFTYRGVQNGGYSVKTRVKFVKCLLIIVKVCSSKSGWLNTYVRYDRTATATHDWDS